MVEKETLAGSLPLSLGVAILVASLCIVGDYYLMPRGTSETDPNSHSDLQISTSQPPNHNPISIKSDESFKTIAAAENWSGDGTPSAPYIISNLNITGFSSSNLIEITNTTVFFQITNCILSGGIRGVYLDNVVNGYISNTSISNNEWSGIKLWESTDCTLTNNSILNNDGGISLQNSGNNNISGNKVSNNQGYGIYLYFEFFPGYLEKSGNCTISGNTVANNSYAGIGLWYSKNCTLSGNTVSNNGFKRGIRLSESGNNTIKDNVLVNDCLDIFGYEESDFLQFTVANNTVDGKPLVYWQNRVNEVIPSSAGQIILVKSTNITVTNQNLSDLPEALLIVSSSDLNILHNSFLNNEAGIRFWNSQNCKIFNNTFFENDIGIFLLDSEQNTVSSNIIFNNSGEGISLINSKINIFSGNIITNNGEIGLSLLNSGSCGLSNNNVSNNNANGISLRNSGSCRLSSNIVSNNHNYGIELQDSEKCSLTNNSIVKNTFQGIYLQNSRNTRLFNNSVSFGDWTGIELKNSGNSTLSYNIVSNNHGDGALIQTSGASTLVTNIFDRNYGNGINIFDSGGSLLSDNIISYNSFCGVSLDNSGNSTLSKNTVFNNSDDGIDLGDSENSTLVENCISNNGGYGIHLHSNSLNNTIRNNDFVGNNPEGGAQASDNGPHNEFTFNYWGEWSHLSDNDSDGIVDSPYIIEGSANNTDSFPLVSSFHLSKPNILFPTSGERLDGIITIQWTESTDILGHEITYEVYYSYDMGNTWTLLASGLSNNSINWDTTTVRNSNSYLIKVVVICSPGVTSEGVCNNPFVIQNLNSPLFNIAGITLLSLVLMILSVLILKQKKSKS